MKRDAVTTQARCSCETQIGRRSLAARVSSPLLGYQLAMIMKRILQPEAALIFSPGAQLMNAEPKNAVYGPDTQRSTCCRYLRPEYERYHSDTLATPRGKNKVKNNESSTHADCLMSSL